MSASGRDYGTLTQTSAETSAEVSWVITTPSEGELLFSCITIQGSSGTITQPTGWIMISQDDDSSISTAMAYKIAEEGEGGSETWNWVTIQSKAMVVLLSYVGIDTKDVQSSLFGSSVVSQASGATGESTKADSFAITMCGIDRISQWAGATVDSGFTISPITPLFSTIAMWVAVKAISGQEDINVTFTRVGSGTVDANTKVVLFNLLGTQKPEILKVPDPRERITHLPPLGLWPTVVDPPPSLFKVVEPLDIDEPPGPMFAGQGSRDNVLVQATELSRHKPMINRNLSALRREDPDEVVGSLVKHIEDIHQFLDYLYDKKGFTVQTVEGWLPKHGSYAPSLDGQFLHLTSTKKGEIVTVAHGLGRVPQAWITTSYESADDGSFGIRVIIKRDDTYNISAATKNIVHFYFEGNGNTSVVGILF